MADPFQFNQAFTVQPSYPFSSYGQPSQYPTPCKEYRSLWCFILGDREPFKVALPFNVVVDVDDLKEVIHIKDIDTTNYTVLPKDLILWKARGAVPLEPHETFVDRVSFSNLAEVATQPGPSQKISTLFPEQPPQDCLHIIVQMSPPDTSEQGLSSLRTTLTISPSSLSPIIRLVSCGRLYSSVTAGSTKHFMDADDDRPPKRSRTGDVEPDIDPSPATGLNRPDYSGGRLVSMCSSFFPDLREDLGRFLVDKTKLIEDIVDSHYEVAGVWSWYLVGTSPKSTAQYLRMHGRTSE